jgi:hypothetical protein
LVGFKNCCYLTHVQFPISLEEIDGFWGCLSLSTVVFPFDGSLLRIKGFDICPSIQHLSMPASVERIEGFNWCRALTGIEFAPDSHLTTIIGFGHSAHLRAIRIPPSVEIFDALAGSAIETIEFPENGRLTDLGGLSECESLTGVRFPPTLKIIRGNAFHRCEMLHDLTFAPGSTIEEISGIMGCPKLERFSIQPTVTVLKGLVACDSLAHIDFEPGSRLRMIDGCSSLPALSHFQIPSLVESISLSSFRYCDSLRCLTFGRGIQIAHPTRSPLPLLSGHLTDEALCERPRRFIIYEGTGALKNSRRRIHVSLCCGSNPPPITRPQFRTMVIREKW